MIIISVQEARFLFNKQPIFFVSKGNEHNISWNRLFPDAGAPGTDPNDDIIFTWGVKSKPHLPKLFKVFYL